MVVGLMSRFSRRSSVHLCEKTLTGRGPSTHEATEMKSPSRGRGDGGQGFHLQDDDATVTQRAIPVTPLMRTALRDS
jgi:hypothetical protein